MIIVEESNECSDIYLHYTLRDIESIRLDERGNEYDLNIRLKNANTTYTTLILRSLYRQDSQESAALILDKNAIFYTQDGALMTPQWPDKLEQKEEFEGIFNVQYHYLHDLNHQDYFEKTSPDQVNILFKAGSGQSPDIIKVGENEIVLTKEQNLILSDTPLFISKKANREKQDEIILQDVSESIAKVMLGEHSMNIEQLIQSISAVITQEPEAQGTDRFVPDFASENPMLSGQWVHF